MESHRDESNSVLKTAGAWLIARLNRKIEYRRWELCKYGAVSLCVFLPCLGRFFHYFSVICLLAFLAFFCLLFGALVYLRIRRRRLIPFVVLGLFGIAYQLAIGKPVGYQTLSAMYETNFHEMLGFFGSPGTTVLAVGGAALMGLLVWLVTNDRPIPGLHKVTFVRVRYLLPLLLLSATLFGVTNWRICETYPICLFYNNFTYIDENIAIADYLDARYTCPGEYVRPGAGGETYLLIIGEAARRSSLSAYGYRRKTSPELDELLATRPAGTVLFTDEVTTAPYTKAAVMSLYSPLTHDEELHSLHTRPGLSKICRGAGMETLYVTARPRYAVRNMLSTFFDDAAEKVYLSKLGRTRYDEDAVPVVREFMERHKDRRKLLIVHLLGSHIKYSMQYPKPFIGFSGGDEMLDTYDTSIRYSDYVIGQIVRLVTDDAHPGVLVYVSDHGENLNDLKDGNYGHGTRALTPCELQVPFVVVFNDAFLATYGALAARVAARKDAPVSHDNITHTILGLAGLSDPYVYRPELDISSPSFATSVRHVTDENMNLYDLAAINFGEESQFKQFQRKLAAKYRARFTGEGGSE